VTTIGIASHPLTESDHRAQLRRAVIASTVGTTTMSRALLKMRSGRCDVYSTSSCCFVKHLFV